MQEQQLYEYAVIRVVPRVEREEFINAGVIVFCKKTGYVDCAIALNIQKLKCFDEAVDINLISENLEAFKLIAIGDKQASSAIARLDAASRFRWLTATRSTIIQCSKVHPGITTDLKVLVVKLLQEMVL